MKSKQSGFISTIILIIIALIILEFVFHIDIIQVLQSPKVQHFSQILKGLWISVSLWFTRLLQ